MVVLGGCRSFLLLVTTYFLSNISKGTAFLHQGGYKLWLYTETGTLQFK